VRVVVAVFLPQYLANSGEAEAVPWLDMLRERPAYRPRGTGKPTREALLEQGRLMEQEITEQKPGWSHALRAHLLRSFWYLREGWTPQPPDRMAAGGAPVLTRLMPALALVSHARGCVRLGEAAEVCGLSRTRFSALFTQAMGASFGAFCQQTRLGHAAHLLTSSDLPLDSIAEKLRFSSGPHLHRAFTRHFGRTPGEFRRREG
jgi:AraC-like DNA-binding protein